MVEANTLSTGAADIIASHGTPTQQRRWLPRLAGGAVASVVADREPENGDGAELGTRAVDGGDHVVVTGTKLTAPLAGSSWVLVVSCFTEVTGTTGWIVVAVSDQTPGFTRGRMLRRDGDRLVDVDVLYFDELRVSAADLLARDPIDV